MRRKTRILRERLVFQSCGVPACADADAREQLMCCTLAACSQFRIRACSHPLSTAGSVESWSSAR